MEAIVSASSSFSYNEDVLIEILSKLPVKSLVRFMSVSQEWSALINSPLFITIHQKYLQRSTPNGYLLYGHNYGSRYIYANSPKYYGISFLGNEDTQLLDLDLPERVEQDSDGTFIRIAGSDNGLVCLQFLRTPNSKEIIIIWNPATGKYRYLSQPLNLKGQMETNDSPVLGFGFINDNGKNNSAEYKVVRIYHSKDRNADGNSTYLTQVFTPSENSWREVKNCIPPGKYYFQTENRISLDGVFYCLATNYNDQFVFSFNQHDEVVHNMPMPPRSSLSNSELFTWENSVAILTYVAELERKYELWVMKKEADTQMPTWKWTAHFTLKDLPGYHLHQKFTTGLRLFVKRHVKAGQDLVAYDAATTEATTKAFKLATGTTCRQVVDYKHSLVSVF